MTGRVEARTGDGSIRLTGTPSVLRVRSGDGSIALRIRNGATMLEDWMVATSDGSVTIELPDGFDAEIEAEPGSGDRVRNDLTLTGQTGGTRDARTLKGTLGDGGKRLTLRTGDGDPAYELLTEDPPVSGSNQLTNSPTHCSPAFPLNLGRRIGFRPRRMHPPFAALAAGAAMTWREDCVPAASLTGFARQRQLERHA